MKTVECNKSTSVCVKYSIRFQSPRFENFEELRLRVKCTDNLIKLYLTLNTLAGSVKTKSDFVNFLWKDGKR